MKPPKLWTPPQELPDPANVGYISRVLRMPKDPYIIGLIDGLLSQLTHSARWLEDPFTIGAEAAAQYFNRIFGDYLKERNVVGEIMMFITTPANPDLLMCDGKTYLKADYPELAAHLEDKTPSTPTTFDVPALLYRFPYFHDEGPFVGGSASVHLTVGQLPSHTHTTVPHSHSEISAIPNVTTIGPGVPEPTAIPGIASTGLSGVTVNPTGDGEPHDNMPPFFALAPYIRAR